MKNFRPQAIELVRKIANTAAEKGEWDAGCIEDALIEARNEAIQDVGKTIAALRSNDTDWDTSYWNQAIDRMEAGMNRLLASVAPNELQQTKEEK